MNRKYLLAIGLNLVVWLILAACQSSPTREPVRQVETVEVQVPVAVRMEPPAELMADVEQFTDAQLPEFVSHAHPEAIEALTQEGQLRLQEMMIDLKAWIQAWQAWAGQEEDAKP